MLEYGTILVVKHEKAKLQSPKAAPVHRLVQSYLTRMGIGNSRKWEDFWHRLQKTHGNVALALVEAMRLTEQGESVNVYSIKNSTLAFSLDVASQYMGSLYRSYLTWFVNQRLPTPSRLLDIGCENGVLTCFYATLFPEAEVIGIDKCTNAIKCARELAAQLKLTNVAFEELDIKILASAFAGQPFDLVTAITTHAEAIDFPKLSTSPSFYELEVVGADERASAVAETLQALVRRETGLLFSLERCYHMKEFVWWARLLNRVGLSFDWTRSYLLSYIDPDQEQAVLPLIVALRKAWVEPCLAEDFLAFWTHKEFEELSEGRVIEGYAAEALFTALNPKNLVYGVEAVYHDGSGAERLELWVAGPLLLTYRYSNLGYRHLSIGSKLTMPQVSPHVENYTSEQAKYAEIRSYGEKSENL